MAGNHVARKRTLQGRSKVKTGCTTCRIRKVKCDENKPLCQKCVGTGRKCDGYESPFRPFTGQSTSNSHAGGIISCAGLKCVQPTFPMITPQDIDLLNRCFSTKTMFDVKLGCDEEAKQVLQASLTEPAIRHAVLSLRALREDLETTRKISVSAKQRTPNHDYGLRQYCMALGGLACKLSLLHSNGLKSALLCCQIFISIEQVRGNYVALAQHVIQGLRIMNEYHARPYFTGANELVSAHHDQLPLLDVFMIKLFIAPCKFTDAPATADGNGTTTSACPIPTLQQSDERRDLRKIVPDMRTALIRIATTTLEFLSNVSHVETVANALELLSEKAVLLDALEAWLAKVEVNQSAVGPRASELLSVSFLRLFHQTLKIAVMGALRSSPDLHVKMLMEYGQLQRIASSIGKRVKGYRIMT
ncbi:hypothetical protein P154DRAFT_460894 [Amniculicola lignicola CBS 123094]|uniref:Zn(2)-C6 fungal-type domain-containing protein n=1 Tax=Amniculicola lignicola CBS 123094 TaxID=1392246 RepID=A0A6A5WVT0_9PLEO|nr:hypothetical protein P154DRAFT_460894 [Amniculicola lignicola CBS 123094]